MVALGATGLTVCLVAALSGGKCGLQGALAIGLATIAGTIVTVQLVGDAMDGTGSLGGTTVGGLLGAGVGIASTAALVRYAKKEGPLLFVLMAAPIIAGSVIGYQLSSEAGGATMRVPLVSRVF